jgi:hypothetical protein
MTRVRRLRRVTPRAGDKMSVRAWLIFTVESSSRSGEAVAAWNRQQHSQLDGASFEGRSDRCDCVEHNRRLRDMQEVCTKLT